jgi:hypothetical protein
MAGVSAVGIIPGETAKVAFRLLPCHDEGYRTALTTIRSRLTERSFVAASGDTPEHWPRSESLIQTALESVSLGLDLRDCALTETVEPQLYHGLRCCRVLRDAQELGYRPACVGSITSLSDGIENLTTTLCGEEDGVQNGEPLCGQLLFARRLVYFRHKLEPNQGSRVPERWPSRASLILKRPGVVTGSPILLSVVGPFVAWPPRLESGEQALG